MLGGGTYRSQYGFQYGQPGTTTSGPTKPWLLCRPPCPPWPPCGLLRKPWPPCGPPWLPCGLLRKPWPPCPPRWAYPGAALVMSSPTRSPTSINLCCRVPVAPCPSPIVLPFLITPSTAPGRYPLPRPRVQGHLQRRRIPLCVHCTRESSGSATVAYRAIAPLAPGWGRPQWTSRAACFTFLCDERPTRGHA